ncbi:MAG: hypothetical protein KF915_18390 [Polyangiaceae bacterium]|nr:hypothetical protein [Polyangiaceae bacterium]
MLRSHQESADRARTAIEARQHDPSYFREALLEVPPSERDAWLDRVLGIQELPNDGPELPSGCVPYLPCPVDALLRVIDHAPMRSSDVFVDVGSGVGRAMIFAHLITGASAIGVEVQPALVQAAQELTTRLHLRRISSQAGDATQMTGPLTSHPVFFLYCPFSGSRLQAWLARLEELRTRPFTVCTVDLPLPPQRFLTLGASPHPSVSIYRST